jgi:hypothetical protein
MNRSSTSPASTSSPSAAPSRTRGARWIAVAAGLCCLASLYGFGAVLDGYSQRLHPPGLLGARGIELAAAFNLLGFALPGLALAWVGWRLRERLAQRSRATRIGAWMWSVSALAWAAQGAFVLDPANLDAQSSRLHAAMWLLWALAFVAGALLVGLDAIRRPGERGLALIAWLAAAAMVIVLRDGQFGLMSGPVAQRLALCAWLAAYVAMMWREHGQR